MPHSVTLQGLVIGTIAGSSIANLGLILSLAAVAAPVVTSRGFVWRGAPLIVCSALALTVVAWDGAVTRVEGGMLLAGLPMVFVLGGRGDEEDEGLTDDTLPIIATIGLAVSGLLALPAGAHIFVGGALDLASAFGVDERVIGLTMVAVGTSLPELFSSLAAARRGMGDLVLGNVIGSNVFNVFAVLGLTAAVRPLASPVAVHADLVAVLAISVAAALLLATGRRMSRTEGAVLLLGYAAFALVAWV